MIFVFIEACPFCRRVIEALTELDLSAEVVCGYSSLLFYYYLYSVTLIDFFMLPCCMQIYPCPKGSIHHRDIVRAIGGKEQ